MYGIGEVRECALAGWTMPARFLPWYVFCAAGLYTFSATDPEYLVTVPLFDEVRWQAANGKWLTLRKQGRSRSLRGVRVNGKPQQGWFVTIVCSGAAGRFWWKRNSYSSASI